MWKSVSVAIPLPLRLAANFFFCLVLLLILPCGLRQPSSAAAHPRLQRAEPPPGGVVRAAPRVIRLWFSLAPNEELDPRYSWVTVWDRRGRRVDDGRGGVDLKDMDRRSMIATLNPIGPGVYVVRWKAVTLPDRGVAQGSFTFTVGPPRAP